MKHLSTLPGRVASTLRAAKALIADPQHWCQETPARNAAGWPCGTLSPGATRWCAFGATDWLISDDEDARECARNHLNAVAQSWGYEDASYVNDCADHATVMRLFDCAIALAEAP